MFASPPQKWCHQGECDQRGSGESVGDVAGCGEWQPAIQMIREDCEITALSVLGVLDVPCEIGERAAADESRYRTDDIEVASKSSPRRRVVRTHPHFDLDLTFTFVAHRVARSP